VTPRIAVVVSLKFPDMTAAIADLVERFTATALATLTELGAKYDVFDTSSPLDDATTVRDCDGLLLLGGGDIHPALSSQAEPVPHSYGVDRRADEDGIAALEAAIQADRPVLGICRGSQLINVAYGGTIVPDLIDYRLHRGGPGQPMFLDERVHISESSRLYELMESTELIVRSGHHQAVAKVGDGLRVAARADDEVIEAIEHPNRWVVGVQWHPEDPDGSAADRYRLVGGFVNACR
jgi:putative glutamine amidotransferase